MSSALAPLRARRRRWALLALPALLLRALVPAGFMPMATADGLSIGFCPDFAALPRGVAAAVRSHDHHHHHHDHGMPDGSAGGAHHAPCLFAASAVLAGTPAAAAIPASFAHEQQPGVPAAAALPFVPSIERTQAARAPPANS